MKNKLLWVAFIASTFVLASCAHVFYTPDAKMLAAGHQTFAIISPSVSILTNSKKVDKEALKEQQRIEGVNFQKELYAWMLKRKMQGKLAQEIQDLETTNAKLAKAGYPETPLTTEELCQVLGVDGVMTCKISMSKPMSEGAAIAIGVVFGVWGPTNEVNVSLSISDCGKKKLIWNYDHTYSGGVGSTPQRLVDDLMRRASRKMPYFL